MRSSLGKIGKCALLLITLWILADTSVYLLLRRFQRSHNLFYEASVPTEEQITNFAQKYYHPRWGWNIPQGEQGNLGQRSSRTDSSSGYHKLTVMGDSFVYGYGVRPEESFPGLVEKQTGWSCLNYGVPGYGTDQALLKYQDLEVRSEFAVLGVTDENIGRCMTVWWGFYRQKGFTGPKPRFMVRDGEIVLVENPAKDCRRLSMMQDKDSLDTLRQLDYWPDFYESLNAPPALTWPATVTVLPHADFFVGHLGILLKNRCRPNLESAMGVRKFYHLYAPDSDGLRILLYIIAEFVRTAGVRNEKPIILVLPSRCSVDIVSRFHKSPYASLVEYLENSRIAYLDLGKVFAGEDYEAYYQGGHGHFTINGNERVATELIKLVESVGG